MSHDITLDEATLRAEQIEVVCRLMEGYQNELEDREVTVLAALLSRLAGGVVAWLGEEQYQRKEARHAD